MVNVGKYTVRPMDAMAVWRKLLLLSCSPWVFDQQKHLPRLMAAIENGDLEKALSSYSEAPAAAEVTEVPASWFELAGRVVSKWIVLPVFGGGWFWELCCIFLVTWKSQKFIAKESVFRWFWARLKSRLTWWRVVKNLKALQMLWNLKYLYRPSLKSHEDKFSLSIQVICLTFHIKKSCSKHDWFGSCLFNLVRVFVQSVPTKLNAISTLEHIRVYVVTSRELSERSLLEDHLKDNNSGIIFVL